MGQEFFINSEQLESKVRNLLPSQGGAGAGFDLSASTQIVPIIDLTESAEGSNFRQDLQTAFSHTTTTQTQIFNTTTTLVNTTGYFRVFGSYNTTGGGSGSINITDGATVKIINLVRQSSTTENINLFDFNVFLRAGDSLTAASSSNNVVIEVATRQIANIDGELTNP
jgi:hypothetical protein